MAKFKGIYTYIHFSFNCLLNLVAKLRWGRARLAKVEVKNIFLGKMLGEKKLN